MNKTITEFYTSEDKDKEYIKNYDIEHGPRLDTIIEKFNLKELKNQKILDIGGGCGFLGKRLDPSNSYLIIDGAHIPKEKVFNDFKIWDTDLDFDSWTFDLIDYPVTSFRQEFNKRYLLADASFCLEVLEHLSNPYHCLIEMKKGTKINGDIYLSIPDSSVTHNTLYPGLIYPVQNFAQFLEQMSLPIKDYFLFDKGWKTHIFKCENASWEKSRMLFPKQESKFFGKTPLEYTNL